MRRVWMALVTLVIAIICAGCAPRYRTPEEALRAAVKANSPLGLHLIADWPVQFGDVMMYEVDKNKPATFLIARKDRMWVPRAGSSGSLQYPRGEVGLSSGGVLGPEGSVVWVYGIILDPKIVRVSVVLEGHLRLEARVVGQYFLTANEATRVPIKELRLMAYDDQASVLLDETVHVGS